MIHKKVVLVRCTLDPKCVLLLPGSQFFTKTISDEIQLQKLDSDRSFYPPKVVLLIALESHLEG